MTRLCFVGFFILCSYSAIADCSFYDGTKTTTVSDGAAISLRQPTKSLETMTIQDQDGLGTCYANTTSTILKSVLPNHPDVSYTHAAIMNTTRGWEAEWKTPNRKYIKDNSGTISEPSPPADFTGGGWVCETIAGMKKGGGACPTNLSVTENKYLIDSNVQQRLMLGLGKYFDNMNSIKDDPEKFEQLKNDLSLAIEQINVESTKLAQQCEERRKSKFPVFSPVKGLMESVFYDQIINPSLCDNAKAAAMKKLLTEGSVVSNDRMNITPNDEALAAFDKIFEGDEKLLEDMNKYMSDEVDLSDSPELVKSVGVKLNNVLLTLFADEDVKNVCPETIPGQSPFLTGPIDDEASGFLQRIYYMKNKKKCSDLLEPMDLRGLLDPATNPNSCMAPTNFELILGAIKPLMEVQTPINEQLIPTLLNPESRYANQIVNALMPACLDKANLISLDNISCADFPFCDRQVGYNPIYNYDGPAGGCYSTSQARKVMRTKTLIGVNQGRALGIQVCIEFMNNPDAVTNHCKVAPSSGEKHGFHEMAVTGYRCKGDQIEYEITNSWGGYCNENKNIECVKDEYGNTTGPFWVKEDALIDSTKDITTVTVQKK